MWISVVNHMASTFDHVQLAVRELPMQPPRLAVEIDDFIVPAGQDRDCQKKFSIVLA